MINTSASVTRKMKSILFGNALDPRKKETFHRLSLIAFFAWVGLGADGLSSSCYGPEEAFLALGKHHYLGLLVAVAAAATVLVISASYSQIIELFPSGGGGYVVASKLLNPYVGMVSGCALLIDYVLTITISIASGVDAILSFLPPEWQAYKLGLSLGGIIFLTYMNMRGIKESVLPLVPVFLIFVGTHLFAIGYAFFRHLTDIGGVIANAHSDLGQSFSELGFMGVGVLLLRSYSMGAGTYTGIEAVSNGLTILREPKVRTGRRTMVYMAVSLAVTVFGLMVAYLLFGVGHESGKTLNAVLFETMTRGWPGQTGKIFTLVTLISEATLLIVAAQAGFLDGPRVLGNMSIDHWFPTRFSLLSDRLVTINGILLMGAAALAMMVFTHASVGLLVVLYSITVFVTFVLSQAGMVRHWWGVRAKTVGWRRKLLLNGFGLALTGFILVSMVCIKFFEGGWITLLVTACLVALAVMIKSHYNSVARKLKRLDILTQAARSSNLASSRQITTGDPDPRKKTAVLICNGYNGLGLHSLLAIIRTFGSIFENFIFVQVGVVDAGNFKGMEEMQNLEEQVTRDLGKYVRFIRENGFRGEYYYSFGTDVVQEGSELASQIMKKYPQSVFFMGQLVFEEETFMSKLLFNNTVFALQRKLYYKGIPFIIMPIRIK
jgi:amino acid transporter